jgi:hypothetical protein
MLNNDIKEGLERSRKYRFKNLNLGFLLCKQNLQNQIDPALNKRALKKLWAFEEIFESKFFPA